MNTEEISIQSEDDIVEKLVPSKTAYASAFIILFLSGIAGGFIGYAMMEVFFPGSSDIILIIGTCFIAALILYGVSVITSLGLQASVEWKARKLTARGSNRPSRLLDNQQK